MFQQSRSERGVRVTRASQCSIEIQEQNIRLDVFMRDSTHMLDEDLAGGNSRHDKKKKRRLEAGPSHFLKRVLCGTGEGPRGAQVMSTYVLGL